MTQLPRRLAPWRAARASRLALCLALVLAVVGCSDDGDDPPISGPDLPTGDGRVYAVNGVFFSTTDGVRVFGTYGRARGAGAHPSVILVHEVGAAQAHLEWLSGGFFEALLENGYNVLALDLRGHGQTPLPDDGRAQEVLYLEDVEAMHLEVRAAVGYLRSQSSAASGRVAVVGNGIGANIAFVAAGAFPEDVNAAVALSPGFWDQDYQPLAVGTGITPFTPRTVLYVAGEQDLLQISETESLSYPDFARSLASITDNPTVEVLPGSTRHGIDLLQSPSSLQLVLDWLAANL